MLKKFNPKSPYVWSFTTYFAEGFPFTIIRTLSSFFLRDKGVPLESIGLTSLFGIPWIIKFLWAPHLDRFGTKRKWLLITQFLLVLMILLTALLAPFAWGIPVIMILFFGGSFLAATHDTAIDGYYLEALDKEGQAKFVGYRVMAYRIAMITGTGIVATIATKANWTLAFSFAAVLFAGVYAYHFFFLPKVETEKASIHQIWKYVLDLKILLSALLVGLGVFGLRQFTTSTFYTDLQKQVKILSNFGFSHWIGVLLFLALILVVLFRNQLKAAVTKDPDSFYSKAFLSFMDRPQVSVLLFFIIFFRTGEFALSSMVSPFFVDLGIKEHYGWLSAAVGLPGSIVGAMLGGFFIAKYSLKSMIWPFVILQNITNLVYMGLALYLKDFVALNTGAANPQSIGVANLALVASVHGFDQIAGGLGTAVLTTFLMRICMPEFKAAHFAIGTGLMSVSGLFAGILGGFLAGWLGYGYFFGISFLLAVPGMLAISFLPGFIYEKKAA